MATNPTFTSVTSGTLTLTGTLGQGLFLGAPAGATGAPSFRAIVSADIAAALLVPPPIGSTTPNSGAFTTMKINGAAFSITAANALTLTTTGATNVTLPTSGTLLTAASAASTYAPLVSPVLTGAPKAPTPTLGDNSTLIPTTAFVQAAIANAVPTGGGRLLAVRYFLTAGTLTYTPTAGTNSVFVQMVGGGTSGQGVQTPGSGNYAAGVGGNAGSYSEKYITSGFSGVTLTVGAGGVGGANGGLAGGTTSFGSIFTAPSGHVPSAGAASFEPFSFVGCNPSITNTVVGTGGDLMLSGGQGADAQFWGNICRPGDGGASRFGPGGHGLGGSGGGSAGFNAVNPGSGGGGAYSTGASGVQNGGNGAPGCIIIYEYS